MTTSPDPRGDLLHAFDAHAETLCLEHPDADREIAALDELAKSIARATSQWCDLVQPLELTSSYDTTRAGALILESVFDEILPPASWRVLAAALALAQSPQ